MTHKITDLLDQFYLFAALFLLEIVPVNQSLKLSLTRISTLVSSFCKILSATFCSIVLSAISNSER